MNEIKDEERDGRKGYTYLLNSLATISDSESETGSELDNEFASQLGTSPGDFSHAKNKDWWFNIQQQLEKETEKQLLSMDDSKDSATSTPSPTPTNKLRSKRTEDHRSKRRSWLDTKEKMAQMLDENSFSSYDPPTMSSSSESLKSSASETSTSTMMSFKDDMTVRNLISAGTSWWDSLKESLEKDTTEETKPAAAPAPEPSSGTDWWSTLTSELEKETTPNVGRSMSTDAVPTTPSPVKQFLQSGGRSRSTSMSASYGRPEEDSGGTMLRIYNGIYRGETVIGTDNNAVAHGVGTFTAANGELYVGQWNQGKRHGKGLRTWKDGKECIKMLTDQQMVLFRQSIALAKQNHLLISEHR